MHPLLPSSYTFVSDSPQARCPHCGAPLSNGADALDTVPTPYDPETFAELVCTDPRKAGQQLAAMSKDQRTRQALAHVLWLERYGLTTTVDEVLATWDATLSS